jgi:N-methylhydantoinase B
MSTNQAQEIGDEINWDGKVHSYRPAADWHDRVATKLDLHTEFDADLDPVTYEVIRNRLWSSNVAHGETLTRISGSPVFQALDFNMCILTEEAEPVMNAPFITYIDGGAPLMVRYIMETFGQDPGIDDGDLFLGNDPWVGAAHQMDVLISCPVFVEGKLFAWVTNGGHQYDLGGIVPGGWPQNAPDVYSDPTVFTPFKLVEKGVLRRDLERMYRRQSRMPDLVALDLRAQLSGCRYGSEEIKKACEQFGPQAVKAAMRRILENAQASMAAKMSKVPDGVYSDLNYLEERMPGERENFRMQLNVAKQGGRLTIDNRGTDAQQEGPIGFVYAAFAGAVVAALQLSVLTEHLFASGGADRQIEFDVEPGLLSTVDYPSSVSGGVPNAATMVQSMLLVVNRMLATDEELRRDVTGQQPSFPVMVLAGVNDRGEPIGQIVLDPVGVGSGAKPDKDGVDTSGPNWCPLMKLLNVEELEHFFPVVYLYRREGCDGGGAGRWRGGTGMELAFAPYRAEHVEAITNVAASGVSTHGAPGLFGGYPSPTTRFRVVKDTNVAALFGERRLPASIDELESGEELKLRGKSNGTTLGPDDVIEMRFTGGGGYGDPLERPPALVAADVGRGYTSAGAAEEVYGVRLGADGAADEEASATLREQMLAERRGWMPVRKRADAAPPPATPTPASGEGPRAVHEYVVARDEGGQRVLACSCCDTVLADYREDYKSGLLVDEGPMTAVPLVEDPGFFVDEEMVFRRFACPGCQRLHAVEVSRASDPVFPEMVLA